jgi:hypothetical protein
MADACARTKPPSIPDLDTLQFLGRALAVRGAAWGACIARSCQRMAFCPECGKSAAAEATRCIHCGHEFAPAEKAGPARFKGTMMMAAPVAAKPTAAANVNAAAPAPAAGANPKPIVTPPAQTPQPATSPRLNVKATMIGQGVGPLIAKPAQPAPTAAKPAQTAQPAAKPSAQIVAKPAAQPPTPTASVNQTEPKPQHIALAETQALFSPADPTPVAPARTAASPAAADQLANAPETPRYLPGDPMAPQPLAARQPALRLTQDEEPLSAPPMQDRKWMLVAAVVVFSVLLLAVGLMY